MTTVNDLIDNAKIYQLVTERLENSPVATDKVYEEICKPVEMNQELIQLILDLYSDDEGFAYEKMQQFSIEDILNYLQATHRYYLNKKLPEIEQSLVHIFSKYADSHQLLTSLAMFFNDYKNKLIDHIRMEEKILFPYIKSLVDAANIDKALIENSGFSIESFISSHSPIEDELNEVSQIIKKYTFNEVLPLPYKIFLNQVDLFELELRKHAIIEDYVLIPMVIELEKKTNK